MDDMCPISLKPVNERVAQINAALVVVLVLLYLLTPYKWIIVIPAIDFFIRGFFKLEYSYFSAVSRTVVRFFKLDPIMVDSGPKVFAAKIGFAFCCAMALAGVAGLPSVVMIIGGVLVCFACFEALFRFCVACKLYPFVHRMARSAQRT